MDDHFSSAGSVAGARFPSVGIRVLICLAWLAMAGSTRAQSAGTLTLSQARLGNVFLTTETVQIPVATNADTVAWSVTDFWGTSTTGASVSVNASGQATVGAPGGSMAAAFDVSVPVAVGSVIDFAVTPGPGTNIDFDAVDYRAQITLPTPTFPTSYNGWQQQNFTAAQIIDPTISGDNAAPLGDGLCNLLKYAFGIAPNVLAAGWEPFVQAQTVDSLPYLTLSFRRVLTTDDLAYLVEAADDLASGAWSASAVLVGVPVDNGDATETDTYRDTVPLTASAKRFMRVRIVRTDGTAN